MSIPAPAPLVPLSPLDAPTQTVGTRGAAQLIGRSERSIRRWIRAGLLPAARTPGGEYMIRVADLSAFGVEVAA